jgi:hypothetical protein
MSAVVEVEFESALNDKKLAAELRAEMRALLEKIAELQNRAARAGMQVGFALARDQFGRNFVQSVDVVKIL